MMLKNKQNLFVQSPVPSHFVDKKQHSLLQILILLILLAFSFSNFRTENRE